MKNTILDDGILIRHGAQMVAYLSTHWSLVFYSQPLLFHVPTYHRPISLEMFFPFPSSFRNNSVLFVFLSANYCLKNNSVVVHILLLDGEMGQLLFRKFKCNYLQCWNDGENNIISAINFKMGEANIFIPTLHHMYVRRTSRLGFVATFSDNLCADL